MSQSCLKVVSKLSQSWLKVDSKLSQSCLKVVSKLTQSCLKLVSLVSPSSPCSWSPTPQCPTTLLPLSWCITETQLRADQMVLIFLWAGANFCALMPVLGVEGQFWGVLMLNFAVFMHFLLLIFRSQEECWCLYVRFAYSLFAVSIPLLVSGPVISQ